MENAQTVSFCLMGNLILILLANHSKAYLSIPSACLHENDVFAGDCVLFYEFCCLAVVAVYSLFGRRAV